MSNSQRHQEKRHVLCYWEGSDVLIQLGSKWPPGACSPGFQVNDRIEIEGEDSRVIEYFEPFTLGPCVIRSLWLGNVGASKLGWAGFRYVTRKV